MAKILVFLAPNYPTLGEAEQKSARMYLLLREMGVGLEVVSWNGTALGLPQEGHVLVQLSATQLHLWDEVIKLCEEKGHFPFHHNCWVDSFLERHKNGPEALREFLQKHQLV